MNTTTSDMDRALDGLAEQHGNLECDPYDTRPGGRTVHVTVTRNGRTFHVYENPLPTGGHVEEVYH